MKRDFHPWTWLVEPNNKRVNCFPWFDWSFQTTSSEISAPSWLLVILMASIATIPWIRHLTWQFSLHTLLIATTLVAVVLGLAVYVARK